MSILDKKFKNHLIFNKIELPEAGGIYIEAHNYDGEIVKIKNTTSALHPDLLSAFQELNDYFMHLTSLDRESREDFYPYKIVLNQEKDTFQIGYKYKYKIQNTMAIIWNTVETPVIYFKTIGSIGVNIKNMVTQVENEVLLYLFEGKERHTQQKIDFNTNNKVENAENEVVAINKEEIKPIVEIAEKAKNKKDDVKITISTADGQEIETSTNTLKKLAKKLSTPITRPKVVKK